MDDLQRRAEHIEKLWREATQDPPCLSPEQFRGLAWHISSMIALPLNEQAEQMDAGARAAMKTLLAWCRYDPADNGLPRLVFRDARTVALETALLAAQPLAEAAPARAWVNRAWSLWGRVAAFIALQGGRPAGHSASSHAVIFTSKALQWVGHPAATPAAVSMELRSSPDYRRRLTG